MKKFYDLELLLEIKQGNHAAFAELYDRYWEELYNNSYKRVKEDALCKDIVQDVFTDIWVRRDSLEKIQDLKAYLHTAVRFQVLKHFSKNKFTTHFSQAFENLIDPSLQTDSTINQKDQEALIDAWLETLPKKRRAIFILTHKEHLNTKEISEQLNVSRKTVQNQLGSAKESLRAKLAHLLPFLF